MEKIKYRVWVMKQSSSAKNKVMIGISPSSRELEHLDTYKWKLFEFAAIDDYWAEKELQKLIDNWTPVDGRPIAGLSYLRQCRPSLRSKKV